MDDKKIYTDGQKLDMLLQGQNELKRLVCDPSNSESHHARIIRLEEKFKYMLLIATPIALGALGLLVRMFT